MFGAKTPFGASSTFGTGTTAFGTQATASPFGQTAASGAGGSIFGTTNTQSGFGTFGATQQTGTTGLFGGTASTGTGTGLFGSTANTGSLFGHTQPVSSSGSIFGANAATSGTNLFGQSGSFNTGTSGFGTTGKLFGTPATSASTGLFGGGTQTSTMFSGTPGFQSAGFGGTQATAQAGTPVKFSVVSGTDQMIKNGIATTVNTRHQCITVMKDYEVKSFEELRFEDYSLGRKSGPTASGGLFPGTTATTTAASTGGLFGTNTSSFSAFGQPKTGFGTNTGTSIFGQGSQSQPTGGLFASKPGGLFGTNTTTTSTSGFGAAFGSTPASGGLFGQTASTGQTGGLFGGTTTAQSGGLFGSGATGFGQTTTGSTGLFGQSSFGQTPQQTGLFNNKLATGTAFGATNTGGLFGASKPASTLFGGLGTGTATAFGTGATNQSLFGKSAFGATNPLGAGFGTATGGTGLFGGTTGLNTGATTLGLVGQTGFGSAFGQTGTALNLGGTNTLLGSQNNALAQQQQLLLHQQILALNNSPFGDSKLFRNSLTDKTKTDKAITSTTASSQKALGSPSHYKVSSKLTAKIKPRPINYHTMNKSKLFEGLDDDVGLSPDTFVPRKSIKKLVIKTKDVDQDSPQNSGLQVLAQDSPALSSVIDSDKDTSSPIGVRFSTGTRRLNNTIDDLVTNGNVSHKTTTETDQTDEEHAVDDSIRLEPCGIMLKRPEYYTKPPIHELNEMVDINGEVWVNDFTVGRDGYGEVKFVGRTNVADLNLDEIVFFRRREIEVYPEGYPNKPPVGEELNKKAEITLEKVWPNDKSTHKPIKTPERLRLQGWLEKVEAATSKLDASFADYRPETGTWVFVVEHFTKYGIHEFLDDESALKKQKKAQLHLGVPISKELQKDVIDEEKLMMLKKLKEQQAKLEAYEQEKEDIAAESMQDQDSDIDDLDQETFPDELADKEEEYEEPAASHQLATVLGVSAHRMQVMKASFFGESEQLIPSPKPTPKSLITSCTEERSYKLSTPLGPLLSPKVVKHTCTEEHETTSVLRSSMKDIFPQKFLLPHAVSCESPSSKIMDPSAIGSAVDRGVRLVGARTHQRKLVPKEESLTEDKENLIADFGLVMGRSFRVGWGPGFTLVHSGNVPEKKNSKTSGIVLSSLTGDVLLPKSRLVSEAVDGGSPFGVVIQRVDVAEHLTHDNESALKQHVSALEVELQHSKSSVSNDGCPLFEPSPGTKALQHHAKICKKNVESFISGPFHDTEKHMNQVWDLVVALWGQAEEEEQDDQEMKDRDSYENHLSIKQALSRWLSNAAKEKVKAEVDHANFEESDYLGAIWSYVAGGQISKACIVAQQHKDHRLALLLAQAAGNSSVRQLLQEQLRDWEVMKADNYISDERLKILALLAGALVWRTSTKTLNACEGLDWKRVFAAHMWYQSAPTTSIKDILSSYDSSYMGDSSYGQYGAQPLPPYQEDNKTDNQDSTAVQDICYHLIKLYCDRSHRLEQALAPSTYTPHQLDYRQSWHLSLALQSLGYTHLSPYHTGVLYNSFAAQLEAMGLWEWSAFVLLHLEDSIKREHAVRSLLCRHCQLSTMAEHLKKEQFLKEKLLIPPEWIHEAKAIRAFYLDQPEKEAVHLLKSRKWNRCHQVVLGRLTSSSVIQEEFDTLYSILSELEPEERSSTVKDWANGGQMLLEFLEVSRKFKHLTEGSLEPTKYNFEEIHVQVSSLCSRLENLPSETAEDRLCQYELAKQCANYLKVANLELGDLCMAEETLLPTHVIVPHINQLPLPEDCALTELRDLTARYILEI